MPVKESKKVTNANCREMETSCTFCAQKLDLPTYFSHAKEVHGVFSCLYCLRYFKFSQELMVHLTREHKVVPQKFASGAEFLERGGTDTTLLCVECNQIFPSDALVTYMKSHVRECRKSTGICPKCGSIQPLTSLGEHILQCQGSKNVNLIGSTTITTSQLRNRDNSCKYCGKKFSPSKIAAHMRACSVRSTKTTINVWNSNRSDILSTSSDVEEKPVTGLLKSSINSVQKNSEARRDSTSDKFDSSVLSSPDSTLSPKVGKSKKFIRSDSLPSVKFSVSKNSLSPQPPKLKRSDSLLPPTLLRTSPKKDSSVTSIKSTKPALTRKSPSVSPPKLPVSSRRNKVQIQFEPSSPLHQSQLTSSPTPLPTTETEAQQEELPPSLSPFSEDISEQVQPKDVPPPEEPVLDPLLREEDQDKRLGILIKELAEKLVEMQQQQTLPPAEVIPQPEPESENGAPKPPLPEAPKYEILVNYSLERKSVDSILSDMLAKTSDDCPYCRLVRLIRIDKRQLAIHMLSKHKWDLRVRPASPAERKSDIEEGKLSSPVKLEPSGRVEDIDSELKSQGTLPEQSNEFNVQHQSGGNPEIKREPSDEAPQEGTTAQDSAPVTNISESNELEPQTTQSSDQPFLPQPSIFDPVCEPAKPSLFDPPESVEKTTPVPSLFDPPSPPPPEPNRAKPSIFEPAEPLDEASNSQVSGNSLPCPSSIEASSPLALADETAASSSSIREGSESLPATDGPCPPEARKTELNDGMADPMGDVNGDELKNATPHSDDDLSKETRNVKEENNESSGKDWEDDNNAAVPLDLTWSDFRITLLAKVFHSQNIVYTFSEDQLSNFGDKPCECLLCGFLADSQKSLFPHWRKTHRGIAMKCTMCKGRFLFAGALYSHLCLGTPEPLTLKENEMEDDDDGNSETVGLRYQCGSCDNVQLPGFFNYMVHLRKDHNRCELCLEQAQTQKELEYHIKKHKLNHFCWKCNLSYCAKPNLMTHLFWKHGTESVDCSKCLKKKWPHIYHFCLPPEYFVCEVCGLYFTRPTALRVHTRLHTGEKLRKCPKHSCQERFISKKLLQKHLESVHAKVEPAPVIPVVVDAVKIEESTGEIKDSSATDTQSEPMKVNGEVMDNNGSEQCPVADDTHPEEINQSIIPPADMVSSEEIPDKQHSTPDDSSKSDDHVDGGENGVKVPPSISSTNEVSEGIDGTTAECSKPEGNEEGVGEAAAAAAIEQEKPTKKSGGKSNGERSPRSKPFNLAKIQGPNLSESESESEDDAAGNQSTPSLEPTEELKKEDENDSNVQPPAVAALPNGKLESGSPSQSIPSSPLKQDEAVKMDVDEAPVATELSSSDRGDAEMHSLVQDPLNVPRTNVDDNTALDDTTRSFSKSQADVVGSDSVLDGGVEKSKSGDEFGSMSPLLLPLEDFDFSVPEIPTFEENHLPEHIIQENALFSIQHEHDYCSPNFSASGFKRKSSSPGAYGQGGVFQGRNDVSESSSPRGRPKKLKAGKSSPKKLAGRKRRRSSSSSSSSSSSCSSCGSNCSCSSSSSGSSSSSSSSSSGSDSDSSDNAKSPVKKSPKRVSKLKIKSLSPKKKSETKVVNNGKLKAEKAVKVPRKKRAKALKAGNNKKTAERNENIEPPKEPEPEPEPFILESDLDTDDSGTEEVFHKKQLTEMIGASKPSTDAVWTMSSEKFLLKVVRGVDDLEQLRPPPPPPPPPPPKVSKNSRGVKYSVKSNGTSEQRLKVRNVPIKPLIVKRDMRPLEGNHMEAAATFSVDNTTTDGYNSPNFHSANAKLSKINSESTPPPMKKMTARVRANQMKAKSMHEGSMSPYVVEDPFATPLPPDGQSPSATKRRASRGGGGGRKSGGMKAEKLSKKAAAAAEAYVDERLYCICQSPHDNVSQMIGCDSKDCQYKWFHFECVDIVIPPKGKWFCSECREVRRQKAAARSAAKKEELQQQQQQQLQN